MGMTRREAFGLILVEHGPMTIIGFVAAYFITIVVLAVRDHWAAR